MESTPIRSRRATEGCRGIRTQTHIRLCAASIVVIGVWAYLELTAGVNLFRRALGVAGLAYVIYAIAARFAA